MYIYFVTFIIYAVLGWILETIYSLFERKKFVNRGFLYGPLCPIYGIGSSILIVVLKNINNIFILFIAAIILTSILEYATGFILEFIFDSSWWNYSENKYNIKGRICLRFSIIWGTLATFLIKIVHPYILLYIYRICNIKYIILFLIACLSIDFFMTILSLYNFSSIICNIKNLKLKYERERLNIRKCEIDKMKNLKNEFIIKKQQLLLGLSNRHKKILDIYPNIKSTKYKIIDEIKEYVKKNKR